MQKHASPVVASQSSTTFEAPQALGARAPVEPAVAEFIAVRAKRLVEHGRFRAEELDDLIQEMTLAWLRHRASFDPLRAELRAFANRVTRNCITRLVRHRNRVKRGQGDRILSLDRPLRGKRDDMPTLGEMITDDNIPTRPSTAHQEELRDLELDVATVMATLPASLRELCEMLQLYSVNELARRSGVPRSTIYDSINKLRRHFVAAGMDEYVPTLFGDLAQKE